MLSTNKLQLVKIVVVVVVVVRGACFANGVLEFLH